MCKVGHKPDLDFSFDGNVATTLGTYQSPYVKKMFHNGQPSLNGVHDNFIAITSTSALGRFFLQQSSINETMTGNSICGISYQLGIYTSYASAAGIFL